MFFSRDKALRKNAEERPGPVWMGKDSDLRSFVRGSGRGSGIPRASPAVVRSGEIHSKVITYAVDPKSTDSNETAERTQEGGLGKHRTR